VPEYSQVFRCRDIQYKYGVCVYPNWLVTYN